MSRYVERCLASYSPSSDISKHYEDPNRAKADSKMTWETPAKDIYVGKNPPSGSKMKGILYPRSGTLGGCTTHNAMVAVYPHASDFSHIVNITGDKSWNPTNMRKLYERMTSVEYSAKGKPGHGNDGWHAISKPPVSLAANDELLLTIGLTAAREVSRNASEEADNAMRIVDGDMNSPSPARDAIEGTFLIPLSIKSGRPGKRSSSRDIIMSVYNAKTDKGEKKYPLDISLDSLVTRVLFAPSTTGTKPRATGVEFVKGKYLYKASPRSKISTDSASATKSQVSASKEVIIAAGAYNSPQLLKLSGIGPKDELSKHKIPLKVDLPGVGTNLQDHFEIGTTSQQRSNFQIIDKCTYNASSSDPCFEQWRKGEGTYGNSNGFIYGVIKKSSVAHLDPVYGNDPDLFLFGGIAAFRGYYPKYSKDVYQHKDWTWVVLKAHTGNRAGTVKLNSADPFDTPDISFNYFDAGSKEAGERDITAMSEAVTLARKIQAGLTTGTAPATPIFTETLPGAATLSNSTAMSDYIRTESWSHHASCTCAIGADNDPMAVLDSKFRVRGVEGLRVVDASIFPRIPGFFIALPTYMIGEKAADSILGMD
jgi:choline dehydrogenase